MLSYLRAEAGLALVASSPLLKGAYARPDKPLDGRYDHPGTTSRLDVLAKVAAEIGATLNQVVLAWLIGGRGAGHPAGRGLVGGPARREPGRGGPGAHH